jgi:hypothetical protein
MLSFVTVPIMSWVSNKSVHDAWLSTLKVSTHTYLVSDKLITDNPRDI